MLTLSVASHNFRLLPKYFLNPMYPHHFPKSILSISIFCHRFCSFSKFYWSVLPFLRRLQIFLNLLQVHSVFLIMVKFLLPISYYRQWFFIYLHLSAKRRTAFLFFFFFKYLSIKPWTFLSSLSLSLLCFHLAHSVPNIYHLTFPFWRFTTCFHFVLHTMLQIGLQVKNCAAFESPALIKHSY